MEKSVEVTRLSSKGQVVLPLGIRERLHLVEGARFVVIGSGDTIVLKKLELPSFEMAQALLYKSRASAKKAKSSLQKIKAIIDKVRAKQ